MEDRAEGLQKVAATDDAQQLPPGTPIGMAIGAEIAPAHPAPIGTVRVRAKVCRGIHLAAAPPRGHHARRRGCGGLWVRVGAVRTGVAVRLFDEAFKGFRFTVALWRWGCGLRCRRTHGGGVAGPHPLEYDAEPYECDQRELVEEHMLDHGTTPSYTC